MQHAFKVIYFENTAFLFQHSNNTHDSTHEDSDRDSASVASVYSVRTLMLFFD